MLGRRLMEISAKKWLETRSDSEERAPFVRTDLKCFCMDPFIVQKQLAQFRRATFGSLALAARRNVQRTFSFIVVLGALWVVVASFAVHSDWLHNKLHCATDPGHFCFVTLLGPPTRYDSGCRGNDDENCLGDGFLSIGGYLPVFPALRLRISAGPRASRLLSSRSLVFC